LLTQHPIQPPAPRRGSQRQTLAEKKAEAIEKRLDPNALERTVPAGRQAQLPAAQRIGGDHKIDEVFREDGAGIFRGGLWTCG